VQQEERTVREEKDTAKAWPQSLDRVQVALPKFPCFI